jgi:hypothetical protein
MVCPIEQLQISENEKKKAGQSEGGFAINVDEIKLITPRDGVRQFFS